MQRLLVVPWSMAATSDRGRMRRLVAVGAPVDRGDRLPDVTHLVEESRGPDQDEADGADEPLVEQGPEDPDIYGLELDLPEHDQDAVDDRGCPTECREDHHQNDGDTEQERADREDRPDDQAHDDGDDAGPEPEELEEADAQRVAGCAGEDDDRGVVPEVRDGSENQPEDERDPPRQDRREEALAEDVLSPLGAGDEAEEERPYGQQDREQLQPVEGPRRYDDDRQ